MELIGASIHKELGVVYELFGFDTGEGLPPPTDFRARTWGIPRGGLFVRRRDLATYLKRATLVIGDVSRTVPPFAPRGARLSRSFP